MPVLSLPILRPSLSLSVWDSPALDGASPIRPPGEVVWPMKREPDRKVPVVRTTELAEMWGLPFAENMLKEVTNYHRCYITFLVTLIVISFFFLYIINFERTFYLSDVQIL